MNTTPVIDAVAEQPAEIEARAFRAGLWVIIKRVVLAFAALAFVCGLSAAMISRMGGTPPIQLAAPAPVPAPVPTPAAPPPPAVTPQFVPPPVATPPKQAKPKKRPKKVASKRHQSRPTAALRRAPFKELLP